MNTGKIYIKSFGCQMNKLDTSLVISALEMSGFSRADSVQDADVVIINTCSVREHAEERVISHLGHLKHIKKSRPHLVVAVIGCMAQRLGRDLLNHEVVDIVAGPAQLADVPGIIIETLSKHEKTLAVTGKIRQDKLEKENSALDDFEYQYDSQENNLPSQAFIRAMRGCNNFCTYCIVPYVRGPEISRSPMAIIKQARKLAEQGIKQVTLLGQTINSYRFEANGRKYGLADLLEMISQIEGIEWIRFITSHPGSFDESILHAMANIEKVCPYLHIPAQSGSDRILKAMNRGYTAQQYLDLLDRARQIVPDIVIAGDFIVGFPGETDQDFQQTADLVRKAEYKNCFVFKYSPRPGTRSDLKMADTIPDEIKKQRNYELLEIQNIISEKYNKSFQDKTVTVLVEGLSKKPHLNKAQFEDNPQLIGRTAADYIVVFNGPADLAGNFADVKITKTAALTLFGELVK